MIFLRPIEIGLACEFLAASGDLHGRFFSRARASSRFHTAKTQSGNGLPSERLNFLMVHATPLWHNERTGGRDARNEAAPVHQSGRRRGGMASAGPRGRAGDPLGWLPQLVRSSPCRPER
jgi:hypothetical protein